MNAHERADMVVKTVKVWQLLQEVDARVEDGDAAARDVVGGFLDRWSLDIESARANGLLPVAQLKTTLALLLVTLCFARTRIGRDEWMAAGMEVRPEYALECHGPRDPSIDQIMRTLRNAAAHGFEDDECVSFPAGAVVRFSSGRSSVLFTTPAGFVAFLRDYTRTVQKVAVAQM